MAADIRVFSFGYSASLDRKKQYVQSMLQVAPVGFASRWKPGGPPSGMVGGVGVGVSVSAMDATEVFTCVDDDPLPATIPSNEGASERRTIAWKGRLTAAYGL